MAVVAFAEPEAVGVVVEVDYYSAQEGETVAAAAEVEEEEGRLAAAEVPNLGCYLLPASAWDQQQQTNDTWKECRDKSSLKTSNHSFAT